MTTTELARCVNVRPSTVRYYERTGVLPKPGRTSGGYRVYTESDADRLRFVHRAQVLGFSLTEITELLDLSSGASNCDDIRTRAEAHRVDVLTKIQDLQRMHGALDELIAACQANHPMAACPIVEALCRTERPTPFTRSNS